MQRLTPLLGALALLCGCAGMGPAPLSEIEKLPVVRVGDTPPATQQYVIFYPAGHPFPARVAARGSLFAREQTMETQVALSRDLYLYKYWASHDGKHWQNSHELLEVRFDGGFNVEGGHVSVTLEGKP